MSHEFLIIDSIVETTPIAWERPKTPPPLRASEGDRLSAGLSRLCTLESDFPLLLNGRVHFPVHGPSGTRWLRRSDGGCEGCLVLAPRDRPSRWIRIGFKLAKGRRPIGWFTLDYVPTTVLAGDNVYPATLADVQTGEIAALPSSAPRVISHLYRLGFYVLDDLLQQATSTQSRESLFDAITRDAIERGEPHVVRAQFSAYLPTDNVARFLQLMAVMFGQTIGARTGIINLADHLGLELNIYPDPKSHEVAGVMLRKKQGNKPLFSLVFYNKETRLRQMRQRKGLPADETATVSSNVRFDVTLHSQGVKALALAARRWLKSIPEGNDDPCVGLRDTFLNRMTESSLWVLERAIFILSHRPEGDGFRRVSFAEWLVPYMLRRVLRLDVIAGFSSESLGQLVRLNDPLAIAWRTDKHVRVDDWAGNLANRAGCTRPTVYAKQKQWRKDFKIEIALPYAFYRDLLHFAPRSLTEPNERDALIAAVHGENGEEAVRLLAIAAKHFDTQRIEVVGSAISAEPHAMSFRVGRDVLPRWARNDQRRTGVKALTPPAERRALREEPAPPNVRGRQPGVAPPPRASTPLNQGRRYEANSPRRR
jgi:hypothetical protein